MTTDEDLATILNQKSFPYPLSKDQCSVLLSISERTLSRYCAALNISAKQFDKENFALIANHAYNLKRGFQTNQSLEILSETLGKSNSETLLREVLIRRFESDIEALLPLFPELITIAIDRVLTRQFAQIAQSYQTHTPLLPGVSYE